MLQGILRIRRSVAVAAIRDVAVTLGQLPEKANEGPLSRGESEGTPMKGVQVEELTPQLRRQLDLSPNIHGVAVAM